MARKNSKTAASEVLHAVVSDSMTCAREKAVAITVPAGSSVGDREVRDLAITTAENDGAESDGDPVDNDPYDVKVASPAQIAAFEAVACYGVDEIEGLQAGGGRRWTATA